MSNELVWPILCLILGLAFLFLEVFVPSGGVIGLLAIGLVGVSLWLAFTTTPHGLKFLIAEAILLPIASIGALILWPHTPIAKRLQLRPPAIEEDEHDYPRESLHHLIGQFGRSISPLRPSGMVDFEGRRLDALSEEGLIAAGTLVKAVAVRGKQLVVRVESEAALEKLLT
jgi:membrane-bound serine protease (ClpP class)